MPLNAGNKNATEGMAKSIYLAIDAELRPPMEADEVKQEIIEESQKAWKTLAYAIAKGVIDHITANMEIYGIQTQGNINTDVSGDTEEALETLPAPYRHDHDVNLSGLEDNVVFTQSNDGTGHVR